MVGKCQVYCNVYEYYRKWKGINEFYLYNVFIFIL